MWRPAQVRNERGEWTWNRVLRETTRGRWGTYAVRDSSTHEVLYVGESSVDSSKRPALRWWKTITRHWQDPTGKFAARKEVTFTAKHPWKYEIALWPASSPEAALRKQADLIARMKPKHNKDDGKAKDEGEGNEEMGAFNFGANVRSNPYPYPAPRMTPHGVAMLRVIRDHAAMRREGRKDEKYLRLNRILVMAGFDDAQEFARAGLVTLGPSGKVADAELTPAGVEWLRVADARQEWGDESADAAGRRGVWTWTKSGPQLLPEAANENPRLRLPPALQREADLFAGRKVDDAPVNAAQARSGPSRKRKRGESKGAWVEPVEAAQANARAMLRASRAPDHAAYWRGYLAVINGRVPLPTYHGDFADQYAAGARDAARVLSTAGAPYSDAMGVQVRELGDRVERQRRAPRQPNPQASKAEREKAAAEYEDTHWGAPAKGAARALDVVDVTHGRLIELGTLARVDYETTKKGDPKNAIYWHEFEHVRPTLAYHACDRSGCPDRGKLVIAGGSYRVQRHGIVG